MPDVEERPVLWGLVALVSVAVMVGLIAGVAVIGGTKVLGISGSSAGAGAEATAEDSLYLPRPSKTQDSEEAAAGEEESEAAAEKPKRKKKARPQQPISLSASQTAVGPMDQIDLTGTYPSGEGAILQVQRFEGGSWSDFPVTVSVSNQTFSTYVQTSQPGENRFRVVDTDTRRVSNEVKVSVG